MPHNSAKGHKTRGAGDSQNGYGHAGIMMGSHQQSWWELTLCATLLLPANKSYGKALWQLPGPGPCGITTLSGLSHTCCHCTATYADSCCSVI